MRRCFPRKPQAVGDHPFAQSLARNLKLVSLQQSFGRQRWPEVLIVLTDQFDSIVAKPTLSRLYEARPRALCIRAAPPPSRYLLSNRCLCRTLTAKTPPAEAAVRLPANISVRTSICCKSRLLTVNHPPKASLPGLPQRSEGRRFYFALVGHFNFALTG